MASESIELFWKEYVKISLRFRQMEIELKTERIRQDEALIIPLIKSSLRNYKEYRVALKVVEYLPKRLQMQLFDELYIHAIESETKMPVNKAQEIILSLPKDFVLAKLREKAEEILKSVKPKITTDLLGLFFDIDKSMARQLTEKVLQNKNKYSQETGKHFLTMLENENH